MTKLVTIFRILLIIVTLYDIINYEKFMGFIPHVFSEIYTKKYEYFIMIILITTFFMIENKKIKKLLKLILVFTLIFFTLLTWMGLVHYHYHKIIFLGGFIFLLFEFYLSYENYKKN